MLFRAGGAGSAMNLLADLPLSTRPLYSGLMCRWVCHWGASESDWNKRRCQQNNAGVYWQVKGHFWSGKGALSCLILSPYVVLLGNYQWSRVKKNLQINFQLLWWHWQEGGPNHIGQTRALLLWMDVCSATSSYVKSNKRCQIQIKCCWLYMMMQQECVFKYWLNG